MRIGIIDPAGVHFNGKVLPEGSVHEITKGPHTNAWLRFKQVVELDEHDREIVRQPAVPASLAGAAANVVIPPVTTPPPGPAAEAALSDSAPAPAPVAIAPAPAPVSAPAPAVPKKK